MFDALDKEHLGLETDRWRRRRTTWDNRGLTVRARRALRSIIDLFRELQKSPVSTNTLSQADVRSPCTAPA